MPERSQKENSPNCIALYYFFGKCAYTYRKLYTQRSLDHHAFSFKRSFEMQERFSFHWHATADSRKVIFSYVVWTLLANKLMALNHTQ